MVKDNISEWKFLNGKPFSPLLDAIIGLIEAERAAQFVFPIEYSWNVFCSVEEGILLDDYHRNYRYL